jgi:hypothetical protein
MCAGGIYDPNGTGCCSECIEQKALEDTLVQATPHKGLKRKGMSALHLLTRLISAKEVMAKMPT